ncbi:hypothetical protein Val02_82140 [Virgisporangium aliadipatigenens]|uniref:Uncharacterized protein n=1 Tax=Virgisporangium aliadipatigenens TaxID=741659 RepID=A0A8J4DVM2_9ACTN|nr:LamG-like jellyroll fold domain-containing protein [Virgisporangium aliadipatigenens]GIJ51328.1 hypothetical protein Val02_82140 [Virgisporangium aliadipatigenens]
MINVDREFVPGCDLLVAFAPGADRSGPYSAYPWTDITDDVRIADRINIEDGRREGASRPDASKCTLTVDNTGGHYCRTNRAGRWYRKLAKNTPLMVAVRPATAAVTDTFTRSVTAAWGSSTGGGAWSPVGAGGSVIGADFDVTGTQGTHEVTAANAYRYTYLGAVAEADVDLQVTVTVPNPAGGALEPALQLRGQGLDTYFEARASIAPGGAVTASIRSRVAGVETVVATATVTGLTHAAATPLRLRAQCFADVIRLKVWQGSTEPTAWHVAGAATALRGPGWIGVRSGVATGNSNTSPRTFAYDNFSARFWVSIFDGDVPELPPRWDRSGRVPTAQLVANGVTRRITKRAKPLPGPLERKIVALSPVGYWTCEDAREATQVSSALPGGRPMSGASTGLGAEDGPLGGAGRCFEVFDTNGSYTGSFEGTVTGSGTSWTVEGWVKPEVLKDGTTDPQVWFGRMRWSGNTYGQGWISYQYIRGTGGVFWADLGFGFLVSDEDNDAYYEPGRWYHVRVTAETLGPTSGRVRLYVDGVLCDSWTDPETPGELRSVQVGVGVADGYVLAVSTTDVVRGRTAHWAAYAGVGVTDTTQAGLGYTGEMVHERLARLLGEARIPFTTTATSSTVMGPQRADTLPDILDECVRTDMGLLYEHRGGYGYQSRAERYNQTPVLVLSRAGGDLGDPPEPTDDDDDLVNDVKATRPGGGWARHEATGAYAPAVVGRADEEIKVNPSTDGLLAALAQWWVHLRTVDELRWPVLSLADLVHRTTLIDAWLALALGSRVQLPDPPDELGDELVDVLVEGRTQTIGWREWKVSLLCVPASPWTVAVVEGAGGQTAPTFRPDTGGSKLTTGISTGATSMQVTTTGQVLWTTTATFPGDFPLDVDINGMKVTVSAITGASSPQTFTVSGVTEDAAANSPVQLWRPPKLAL